jgi:hypothetical protein
MAEKKGKGIDQELAAQQMQALNSSPIMHVKEILDAEGNMVSKEVEVMPRNASCVEFCMDSKGQIKPRIKVYHESPEVALEQAVETMAAAIEATKNFPTE